MYGVGGEAWHEFDVEDGAERKDGREEEEIDRGRRGEVRPSEVPIYNCDGL